jgi:hypothetical protein
MYILEGEAQVLLWVPRAAGEETGDPPPAAWSEDSLAPEALHTAGSQAHTPPLVQDRRLEQDTVALQQAHQHADQSTVQHRSACRSYQWQRRSAVRASNYCSWYVVQRSAPLAGDAVAQGIADIPAGLAHVSLCWCNLLLHQG